MSLPTPGKIKAIAIVCGYEERRDEVSNTLFFKDTSSGRDHEHPILINVFYTTRGVMTKISHPTTGYNQLWRSDAYNSTASLQEIFANPRMHTGKGYRTADNSVRGCAKCGQQTKRAGFSKNQWRRGPGHAKCTGCVQCQQEERETGDRLNEISRDSMIGSITCDAEGCEISSPAVQCTLCLMVYYCSRTCQRQHQLAHLSDCFDINVMRERFSPQEDSHTNHCRGMAMVTQLSGKRTFDALLNQAEYIHQADGDWERAIALYRELLMREQECATAPQWRQVWMGFSRCFYEMGEYDKAVGSGTAALQMNRHFPQAHKYVALAQKANGNHALAINTMKNAVLYETPWDDKNIEANRDLLRKIITDM